MKSIKAFGLLGLLAGCFCVAQTLTAASHQSRRPGYSITLTASKNAVQPGAPIKIIITVTNITSHDIYWRSGFGKDSAYQGFRFSLRRNGHEPPTTFFHRKMAGRQRVGDPHQVAGGSFVTLAHPPGKMFEIPIDLKRLYKITNPGLYTLKVSRYDKVSKTIVHSNVLKLKIEE